MRYYLVLFVFISSFCAAFEEEASGLLKDLDLVREINLRIKDELPLFYNYQLQGGYFTMPSARMPKGGNIGFGFAFAPPYQIASGAFQLFDRVEFGGNYWIYSGVTERFFGNQGFGDDAERAAFIKVAIMKRTDGFSHFPEVSFGWNDFIGTRRFQSYYVVATQSFLDLDLELTAGWGSGRIHGFFLGGAWSPFRHGHPFFKNLSFVMEYDANNYKSHGHEHVSGREVKSRLNGGIQWSLYDFIHLSASTLRGKEFAGQAQLTYNLGETKGFFPKIYDPLPYSSPVDTEPLGMIRSDREMTEELIYAFAEQGFDLYTAVLIPKKEEGNDLWLKVINVRYREEDVVRRRVEEILSSLLPANIDSVSVVIEAEGVSSQEYVFRNEDLQAYRLGSLNENEFRIISPLKEASRRPSPYASHYLYQRKKSIWMFTLRPLLRSYFGSASGKYKFDVGFIAGPQGYLFDELYYSLMASYTIISNSHTIGSVDSVNPSQLVNVRTDAILYRQTSTFHIDQAYVQKSWNCGAGCFLRTALGYFEIAYAGFAGEFLFYPVQTNWAIGFQMATVWKRSYHGLGFQNKVRKLKGNQFTYVPYFGWQYFLDLYYQYQPLLIDFRASFGQFLAWDKGVQLEAARTYPSGLKIGFWVTYTNGNDVIGGSRYFDKGFSITMPLDIFMNKSSRTRVGYAMAAWLRDVGARASTGANLYDTLYFERFNSIPSYNLY